MSIIEDNRYNFSSSSSAEASSSYFSSSSSSSPMMMMMMSTIDERIMQQQQQDNDDNEGLYTLTPQQLQPSLYIPRILGIIIVLSSIFMFSLAWKRRDRLFHRLVLGMAVYEIIWGGFMIYGAAAVPKETTNATGNVGTILTCSISGFCLYSSCLIACSYYCSFAIYSYVGVLNNFKKIKYLWIEKYIHIFVHIYPIASGIYILTEKSFNNTGSGYCFIQRDPLGCGYKDYDNCERGPNTDKKISRLIYFWEIGLLLILVFSTIIMIILIIEVKMRQNEIRIKAAAVIKQTIVYLVALYVGISPSVILHMIREWSDVSYEETIYINTFSNVTISLFGVWCMLVHRYFSTDNKKIKKKQNNTAATNADDTVCATKHVVGKTATKDYDIDKTLEIDDIVITDNIFSSQEIVTKEDTNSTTNNKNNNNNIEITATTEQGNINWSFNIFDGTRDTDTTTEQQESGGGRSSRKWSFNIFDGTNGSGAFADFIHDGDSDDERVDNEQTIKWSAVQDHV